MHVSVYRVCVCYVISESKNKLTCLIFHDSFFLHFFFKVFQLFFFFFLLACA